MGNKSQCVRDPVDACCTDACEHEIKFNNIQAHELSRSIIGRDNSNDKLAMPESLGVQAMLDSAKAPWSLATMAIVQDDWYKDGGMSKVMDEYYDYHTTKPAGALRKLGLTHSQMEIVRQRLDTSGELKKTLEDKIMQSISADGRYVSWESVIKSLENDSSILLRGDWLADQASGVGKLLPRRQELHQNAVWDFRHLTTRLGLPEDAEGPVAIVAVSYCWLSSEHPDPEGFYFNLVSALVSAAVHHLNTWRGEVGVKHARTFCDMWMPVRSADDIAIFWDWCSMYQQPRVRWEEELFQQSLKDVDIWFTHRGVHSWICHSKLDADRPKSSDDVVAQIPRGWPTFEYCLSGMIKDPEMVLSLCELPPLWRDWKDIQCHCRSFRGAPLKPDSMTKALGMKNMAREDDRSLLIAKYKEVYADAIVKTTQLAFRDIPRTFDPSRFVKEVAEMLPQCFRLQQFVMHNLPMQSGDVTLLVGALCKCNKLIHVELRNASLTGTDMTAVASLTLHCESLKYLLLPASNIRNDGVAALAQALPKSQLSMLGLEKNRISDAGALSLASSFSFCQQLRCITLYENVISANCKKNLDASWEFAGLPDSELAKSWATIEVSQKLILTPAQLASEGGLFLN